MTVHPVGERVVEPKLTPFGAAMETLVRSSFFSLAALNVKNVGVPVGNCLGLISSWAKAGAAIPSTAAAPTRNTTVFLTTSLSV